MINEAKTLSVKVLNNLYVWPWSQNSDDLIFAQDQAHLDQKNVSDYFVRMRLMMAGL